jgi:hypothetical protein
VEEHVLDANKVVLASFEILHPGVPVVYRDWNHHRIGYSKSLAEVVYLVRRSTPRPTRCDRTVGKGGDASDLRNKRTGWNGLDATRILLQRDRVFPVNRERLILGPGLLGNAICGADGGGCSVGTIRYIAEDELDPREDLRVAESSAIDEELLTVDADDPVPLALTVRKSEESGIRVPFLPEPQASRTRWAPPARGRRRG